MRHTVVIPVQEVTAAALSDARRREAVGYLVDRLISPDANDPLLALLENTAAEAGLSQLELEAELQAYNAERRALMST